MGRSRKENNLMELWGTIRTKPRSRTGVLPLTSAEGGYVKDREKMTNVSMTERSCICC